MSAPVDPLSNFLVQNDLLPYLLSLTALSTITMVRKRGAAIKRACLDALQGLRQLHAGLCDCLVGCHANWWRLRMRCAENTRRYKSVSEGAVHALEDRAGAD